MRPSGDAFRDDRSGATGRVRLEDTEQMFKKSNRSRNLVILAVAMFLVLVGAMAVVFKGPGAAAAAGDDAGLQAAALVQARQALRGSPRAFDALARTLSGLEDASAGDASSPVALLRSSGSIISKSRAEILGAHAVVADLEALLPQLDREIGELQSATGNQSATSVQLGRLGDLVKAAIGQVRALVTGPGKPTDIADALGQAEIDAAQIILGLQSGDPGLDLRAVSGGRAQEALARLVGTRDRVFTRIRDARALGDRLDLVAQASTQLDQLALQLTASVGDGAGSDAPARDVLVIALLVLAAVILSAMVWVYLQAPSAPPAPVVDHQADRNQQAILRLLDELSSLADGDLTVQATVTEDITGAIADSINYAVEALRELVTTINESAIQLDGAARSAEGTAVQLAQASEAQSRQVDSASQAIGRMVSSIEEVSGDAERSSDVARHSVDVAHKGGEAVRRTIEGMNAIRETIQDTSKRIKRLGESSQEIGNIVELINDIADQTNILALNASIQASMAGEAGRGFAVVADEVQRLAERSTNATKQIEVLVRTIQADTNEAIVSMERSTTDVVGGALLAENAGAALEEIEQVSSQIASLVQNISNSAHEQAGSAAAVIRIVELLQQINSQAAVGTSATRESISKLAELAAQLRQSAAGFRLPATVVAGHQDAGVLPGEEAAPEEAGDTRYGEAGLRVIGKRTA